MKVCRIPFPFVGWGIIWKVLLSRLGLFRELFNSKSSTDDSSKASKRGADAKQLKSSLIHRHRVKDGSSTKKVWFDKAASELSNSFENEEPSEFT